MTWYVHFRTKARHNDRPPKAYTREFDTFEKAVAYSRGMWRIHRRYCHVSTSVNAYAVHSLRMIGILYGAHVPCDTLRFATIEGMS